MGIVLFLIAVLIYLIPSLVALNNKKANSGAIFALNLLLGWSIIGWVGALIWAITKDKQPDRIQIFNETYNGNELGYLRTKGTRKGNVSHEGM